MNFLFVCAGNTCRSPMAEGIARRICQERGLSGFSFSSSGLYARPGERASEGAIWACARLGADIGAHCARAFEAGQTLGTVTLCMTDAVLREVLRRAPGAKAYTLCAFAGERGEIADPYMLGNAAYAACAAQIRDCLQKILISGGQYA